MDDYPLSDLQRSALQLALEAWLAAQLWEHIEEEPPRQMELPDPGLESFVKLATSSHTPARVAREFERYTVTTHAIVHLWLVRSQLPEEEWGREDGVKFSIKPSEYNSARASVSRALKRMTDRGYLARVGDGYVITEEGIERGGHIWRDQIDRLLTLLEDPPADLDAEKVEELVKLPPR